MLKNLLRQRANLAVSPARKSCSKSSNEDCACEESVTCFPEYPETGGSSFFTVTERRDQTYLEKSASPNSSPSKFVRTVRPTEKVGSRSPVNIAPIFAYQFSAADDNTFSPINRSHTHPEVGKLGLRLVFSGTNRAIALRRLVICISSPRCEAVQPSEVVAEIANRSCFHVIHNSITFESLKPRPRP